MNRFSNLRHDSKGDPMAAIYLVYLRKSRQDNPDESVEEVLAKHEIMLQE